MFMIRFTVGIGLQSESRYRDGFPTITRTSYGGGMKHIIPSKDFKTLSITEFTQKYKGEELERALIERCIYFQYKYRETTDELNNIKQVVSHMQTKFKIPRLLKTVEGLNYFKYKDLKCVYFLMKRQRIVYIGQSINLPYRIGAHIRDGVKDFDKVFYVIVKKEYELDFVEKNYIWKLRL